MKRRSQRFDPSSLAEKLVPTVLALLALGLLVTLAVILLSVLGLIPAA